MSKGSKQNRSFAPHSLFTCLRLRLIGVKIGGMENEERKTEEKMMFFLILYRKKTQMMENVEEKNPPEPTIFFPLNLGGKLGRKERRGELNT